MKLPAREEYDRMAAAYDRRWSSYTESTLGATLDGLDLREGDRVLDLASGTGELALRLLSRFPRLAVVGADISAAMLAQGRRKLVAHPWAAVRAGADRLPFLTRSFDAVFCANAFHMFPNPEATLDEIRRVLRPGGQLTLTDWCDDYVTCKVCSLYLRLTNQPHRRVYGLRICRNMLRASGFEVVGARRFKVNWLWGLMKISARRQ